MELHKITKEALKEILKKHLAWLNDEPDGEKANLSYADLSSADLSSANLHSANLHSANLHSANLSYADLSYADLSSADLSSANLSYANLRSADLDMSVFPLWCGSLDIKVDIRLSAQIAYHFCRFETEDPEVKKAQKALKTLANKFHRIGNDVEKIP